MKIIIRKFINFSIITVVVIVSCFFYSCNLGLNTPNIKTINFKDSIRLEVNKIYIRNKILVLNDSFCVYKSSALIFKNHQPQWIFDRYFEQVKKDSSSAILPTIKDVAKPYIIIKSSSTNLFQLIKNKDTLLFNFDDIDPVELSF